MEGPRRGWVVLCAEGRRDSISAKIKVVIMTIEAVIRSHLTRYPAMQFQDIYKLIHQAAMGSEHAISSAEMARNWLERELAGMGTGPDETPIDSISPDGQIVRVHLRPYRAQGGDPGALLDAFISTANEFRSDRQLLQDYWNTATEMQHFSSVEMDEFIQSVRAQNYPVMHHSPEYKRLYRPAYRVVWRKYLN